MKKLARLLLLPILLFCLSQHASAQFEAKVNPIVLLFGGIAMAFEYPTSDQFGMEALVLAVPDATIGGYLIGKYYLNPKHGADRFNCGMFLGGFNDIVFNESAFGIGFLAGTKIVSKQGVTFDIGIGLGRGFGDIRVLPYARLDVGYRFGDKKLVLE